MEKLIEWMGGVELPSLGVMGRSPSAPHGFHSTNSFFSFVSFHLLCLNPLIIKEETSPPLISLFFLIHSHQSFFLLSFNKEKAKKTNEAKVVSFGGMSSSAAEGPAASNPPTKQANAPRAREKEERIVYLFHFSFVSLCGLRAAAAANAPQRKETS